MKTCIFTKKFDSLINDTLPHAERKLLAAHLGEECEVCEKFLREADEEKRITLFALLENDRQQKSQEFAYNEAKKNAILRTIISQKELSSFASLIQKILANSTRPALTAVLIGVFALSFVFIYLKKEIHEVSYTGIKGTQTSPITLTAQFGTMNGKDRKIQGFVENNMSLSRAHDLFFSFQLKTTGYLYLVEKAQNHTKLIYPQTTEKPLFVNAGAHDLKINNRIAAYSLEYINKSKASFCAYVVRKKIETLDELQKEDNKSCLTILVTE